LIPLWLPALLAASVAAAPAKPAAATKPVAGKTAVPKFTRTTVRALLGEPKKWDGKLVEVEGTVEEYEQRTSKAGHEYSKFRLAMPDVKERAAVFSFNHLGLANGKKAKVRGLFQETKKVGEATFKNEIDASKPKGSVVVLP
jgi:hypothetical protein